MTLKALSSGISNYPTWEARQALVAKRAKKVFLPSRITASRPLFSPLTLNRAMSACTGIKVTLDGNDYQTEQVFYTSKDGTRYP